MKKRTLRTICGAAGALLLVLLLVPYLVGATAVDDVQALQKQLAELETRYAAAIAERDEIWEARCWFQTKFEQAEKEMQSLQVERDTLRVALAKQGELDLLKQEIALREARYAEVAATLAEMRQRFDAFEAHHATAKAQNNALLEELNRTQRERIEALERAADLPSR